jgi:hypothetical protein
MSWLAELAEFSYSRLIGATNLLSAPGGGAGNGDARRTVASAS